MFRTNRIYVIILTLATTVFYISALITPSIITPSEHCNSVAYDLIDCVRYLSEGSNGIKPDSSCCSGLETAIGVDPDCVCMALTGSAYMGVNVNMTRALDLPSACGVSAPNTLFNDCGSTEQPPPSEPPCPKLSSPPPVDCNNLIYDMYSCISFMSNGSFENEPDSYCCSGVKSVIGFDTRCLCETLKGIMQMGMELNLTRTIALPSTCGVSSSHNLLSNCDLSMDPAGACVLVPGEVAPKAHTGTQKGQSSLASQGSISPAPAPSKSEASFLSTTFFSLITSFLLVITTQFIFTC